MSELQHQTDVEQAKAKLQQVAETKEARKDPRAGELTAPAQRLPAERHTGEKNIRPIEGKPKKKKFSQKLKEAMFSEDIGNGSVTEYVFFKILVPSVKQLLSNMANTAINMALGLDPKTRTIATHTANASMYRDRNYSRQSYAGDPGMGRRLAISEYEWDEDYAQDIFGQMQDVLEHYPELSIADVYSIMNMGDKIRTTDRNWGWTSMRGIEMVPLDASGERWRIDMPPARPLR